MSAGERLQAAVIEALQAVAGLGCYAGPPVQAAVPYAMVEAGPESDWSHKSGRGREVRLAITLRDEGESAARLRRLMEEGEEAIQAIPHEVEGWRIVTFHFLRSRLLPPRTGGETWVGIAEFRARMLEL
jgi:hypothetical protein